jgi:hypothetical protein
VPEDHQEPFVGADFVPPSGLRTHDFVLEPLGPQHNDADYAAWTSSIPHIRSTSGFTGAAWPDENLSLAQNLSDLIRHADDFSARKGFTYTVLEPLTSKVIGCVYIYPSADPRYDARVRSWVSVQHAALDQQLRRGVAAWLARDWPFRSIDYFGQPAGSSTGVERCDDC